MPAATELVGVGLDLTCPSKQGTEKYPDFCEVHFVMFLFSNHSFIEIRKSLLVAIARMEVKNSKQSIIKINLNGFKVRVKALIHDAIFRPSLFLF